MQKFFRFIVIIEFKRNSTLEGSTRAILSEYNDEQGQKIGPKLKYDKYK